jgi:hypothetical protein
MDLESGALLLDGEERTVLPRREAADDLPPIEIAEADIDEPTAWVLRQLQAATQGDENGSSSSGSQSPTESATVAE